jgi:hypothetical protein
MNRRRFLTWLVAALPAALVGGALTRVDPLDGRITLFQGFQHIKSDEVPVFSTRDFGAVRMDEEYGRGEPMTATKVKASFLAWESPPGGWFNLR